MLFTLKNYAYFSFILPILVAGYDPNSAYDVVLMFKIILLKRFYNMSDEQCEYQINDRVSFREFLGLSSDDRVPDARTIRLFQDTLIEKNLEENLFDRFHTCLEEKGLFVNEGKS